MTENVNHIIGRSVQSCCSHSCGYRSQFLYSVLPLVFLLGVAKTSVVSSTDRVRGVKLEQTFSLASSDTRMSFTSHQAVVSFPTIVTRFANPQYDCITEEYCLDVEFQSDLEGYEIYGMNTRLFYDAGILELIDVRDFQGGYDISTPFTTTLSPPGVGYTLFGFGQPGTGIATFVNGAIQLVDESAPPIHISTTEWTSLFRICFAIVDTVSDPEYFCPPVVWDLEQDPENGGFLVGDDGVVLIMVDPMDESLTIPAIEQVEQFNWQYIGDGSPPYGEPIETDCISVACLPVLTCPPDLTVLCDDATIPEATGYATGTDFCSGQPLITYTDSMVSGSCGSPAVLRRTWIAEDDCGRHSECLQLIVLNQNGVICGHVEDDLGQMMGGVELQLMADVNGNGIIDPGDTLLMVVFSDSVSGDYCFPDVSPYCSYIIWEVQPEGYGSLVDFDITPDPDGNDSLAGPNNIIPVFLDPCESDEDNLFVNIVCPDSIPQLPKDTICAFETAVFEVDSLQMGEIDYNWTFGLGADPPTGSGTGPHIVSFAPLGENESSENHIMLVLSKDGCLDWEGEVTEVQVYAYPDATIAPLPGPTCYYMNMAFVPAEPELPGATYIWNFGANAIPATATGYGPHNVYYTSSGIKSVKLVVHPFAPGASCPDSTTLNHTVINCPAQIVGYVLTDLGMPISGVNIRLYADSDTNGIADNGTAVRSVFTNTSGQYSMAALIPGHYVIVQVQPSGWISVNDYDESDDGDVVPNVDSLDNLIPASLYPTEIDSFNIFIETAMPGSITGSVFIDINGNQAPDPGEGMGDVTVSLYADSNTDGVADAETALAVTQTNVNGDYSFLSVPVGHYVLIKTQPSGYDLVKDFDASNDGDAVPNTNTMDNIIPVSIFNGETDAHNYYIETPSCPLLVVNTDDNGFGSLRYMIDCAVSGDTIQFHPSLSGQTIHIQSARLLLEKSLVFWSNCSPRLIVSSGLPGLFELQSGVTAEFFNLNVISGLDAPGMGIAFDNHGILKLWDTDVLRNTNASDLQALIRNHLNSLLEIKGDCYVQTD